jgi:hypothetical protein
MNFHNMFGYRRAQHFQEISQSIMDGILMNKLDGIGIIRMNGKHYFNVFRRYNSAYEIVIEDLHEDYYYYKDMTPRESVSNVMCLSAECTFNLSILSATSMLHSAPIHDHLLDMKWSEIVQKYSGVSLNIHFDYPALPYQAIPTVEIPPPVYPVHPDEVEQAESDEPQNSMRHSDTAQRRSARLAEKHPRRSARLAKGT